MNQVEIIKYIENIAKNTNVKTITNGDVYNIWNSNEIKYSAINTAIEDIIVHEDYTEYNFILYYGDRLLNDDSNFDFIQIDGIRNLNYIINKLKEVDYIDVVTPYTFTPFQQKFADYLGGIYVRFTVQTSLELNC